jgi:sulfite reductase (NADPH) hemoprotein beta-component
MRESFADVRDIDEFVEMLNRFERGEITAEAWRKFRLLRGTYGQRQDDVQMQRVKIPQGVVSAQQLEVLADVAERYSRGFCHVTTRQNIQFHFVPLAYVEPAMRLMADAGMTTREACGNSVRNVTACPYAGVSAHELFDVTPYAEALTRYFLRHSLSSSLPRKFKIAFEGCREDHVSTAINDLGWTARVQRDGDRLVRGFRLTVGGGTSILPTSGRTLIEFAPAGEMLEIAEAIVRVYARHGDYEHRQRNRMKFLIRAMGWDAWSAAVFEAREEVRREGGVRLPFDPDAPPEEAEPLRSSNGLTSTIAAPGFAAWRATNVVEQRQPGFVVATVRLLLGDITAAQLRTVAQLSRRFGDGSVRLTADQNLLLRWVPQERLPELHRRLAAAGLGRAGASTIADVTSCPGAESCRLAVTQSRGLGRELAGLLEARPELMAQAESASLKISGCPNGCGQHHVATIGFQGSVRKVGGNAVPQYFVMLGGRADSDNATFARLAAKIPARRVAAALERLLDLYRAEKIDGETAGAFFQRVPVPRVKALLADLEALTPETVQPEDHVDLGESAAFVPEVMEGECAS